jgi:hypothetical protein
MSSDQNYWSWTKKENNSIDSRKKADVSSSQETMDIDVMSSPNFQGTILEQVSKATLITPTANSQLHQLDKKKSIFKSKLQTKPLLADGSKMDLMSIDNPAEDGFLGFELLNVKVYQPPDTFESVFS